MANELPLCNQIGVIPMRRWFAEYEKFMFIWFGATAHPIPAHPALTFIHFVWSHDLQRNYKKKKNWGMCRVSDEFPMKSACIVVRVGLVSFLFFLLLTSLYCRPLSACVSVSGRRHFIFGRLIDRKSCMWPSHTRKRRTKKMKMSNPNWQSVHPAARPWHTHTHPHTYTDRHSTLACVVQIDSAAARLCEVCSWRRRNYWTQMSLDRAATAVGGVVSAMELVRIDTRADY